MLLLSSIDEGHYMLACAVSSAILSCGFNAMNADNPDDVRKWERQADKLESNFKRDFHHHYSTVIDYWRARGKESA